MLAHNSTSLYCTVLAVAAGCNPSRVIESVSEEMRCDAICGEKRAGSNYEGKSRGLPLTSQLDFALKELLSTPSANLAAFRSGT